MWWDVAVSANSRIFKLIRHFAYWITCILSMKRASSSTADYNLIGLHTFRSSDDVFVGSASASTPSGQVPDLPDPRDRRSTTTSRPRLGASVASTRQRSSVLDGNHPRPLRGRADGFDSRYVYPALTDDRTQVLYGPVDPS